MYEAWLGGAGRDWAGLGVRETPFLSFKSRLGEAVAAELISSSIRSAATISWFSLVGIMMRSGRDMF